MKTHKEQIMGRCIHYRAPPLFIRDKGDCLGGVPLSRFGTRVLDFPCFDREQTRCPAAQFPTEEEADAEVEEDLRLMRDVTAARAVIKGTGLPIGTVTCPRCLGKSALHFSVAKSNGHVHAACETKGCLSWME